MLDTHRGRVAIVTGAARGIGQEAARQLAQRGAAVVLVDLESSADTAGLIGGDVLTLEVDVSEAQGWAQIAQAVDNRYGRADIVINNAGIYPNVHIDDLSYEVWSKTLRVNLDAHFHSAKAIVPLMRRNRWGRFVNISSNSIGTALPGLSHYMASKMGVIGFVRGLANDLGADGITVNAILPALTQTPGTRPIPEEVARGVWQSQCFKRFAEPKDIVGPMLFLTSADGAFVTGQALAVDGGMYKIS